MGLLELLGGNSLLNNCSALHRYYQLLESHHCTSVWDLPVKMVATPEMNLGGADSDLTILADILVKGNF